MSVISFVTDIYEEVYLTPKQIERNQNQRGFEITESFLEWRKTIREHYNLDMKGLNYYE